MEGDPLIYIVTVLIFYSCGIVILMINYMKKVRVDPKYDGSVIKVEKANMILKHNVLRPKLNLDIKVKNLWGSKLTYLKR